MSDANDSALTLRSIRCVASVDETASRVEQALIAAGMKIFARIDQSAEARAVGLTMPPMALLLFGNPKGGTPLMIARPTVGIDLPLKALVWKDDEGATWLTYNTPALLEQRHGLDATLAVKLAPAATLLERTIQELNDQVSIRSDNHDEMTDPPSVR